MARSGESFFAFLFGIVTGAVIGILFAPDKGRNTRDQLSFHLDKYKKRLEGLAKELIEGNELEDNNEKKKGNKVVSEVKNKAEKLLDDVNGLISHIKLK